MQRSAGFKERLGVVLEKRSSAARSLVSELWLADSLDCAGPPGAGAAPLQSGSVCLHQAVL